MTQQYKPGRARHSYLEILGELDNKGLGGGVDREEGSGLKGSERAQVDNCTLPPDLSSTIVQNPNIFALMSALYWSVFRNNS